MDISKIIIPAAGIGSRFLPITKSIPKEMLPLSNKPAIEYIVQEAVDANITDVGIIISPEKNIIKEYFSPNINLDNFIKNSNQHNYLNDLNKLIENAKFSYFYQNNPAGLADALMHAQDFVKLNEFFTVALPDDIIFGKKAEISNLIEMAQLTKGMVIAVQEVPEDQISNYGIVKIKKQINDQCFQIDSLIEKPQQKDAPSSLAIVGRYVFSHELFNFIPQTPCAKNGEILLPETVNLMIQNGFPVFACKIQGKRFDTGTPQGWLNYILNQNK